jgi:hypothetical protein
MLCPNIRAKAQITRLFPVHYLLKAIPHESLSYCAISLGNSTHILAYKVAKGTLVGRGYLLNKREDYKGEGN